MDTRFTLLFVVLALAAGFGLGWWLGHDAGAATATPAASDAPFPASREEMDAVGPGLGTDRARLAAATQKLEEETRRREAAESALEEARTRLATLEPAAAGHDADGPPAEGGTRFDYEAFSATLSKIDWAGAGEAIAKMSPMLGELATTLQEGKPIPPSVGDIQKYNGELVKMALTVQQSGMPGTGVNGAFTHPSILANLVYSTLRAAGKPLSAGQEARLREIADRTVADDARRLAGYGPETLALQKVWDETRIKDRFYADVDGLVTDEQREILHPQVLRGRMSFDLFSSGLVWMTVVAPQRYHTVDELRAHLVAQVADRFAIPAEQGPVVEDVVAEWLRAFPAGYLDAPSDALEQGGRLKLPRVRVAAEIQLRMLHALLDRLPADSPAVAKIHSEPVVAVPVKLP